MKRVGIGILALVVGCAWSNSLYQARVISSEAMTAEREKRPAEAQQLWGQVIAKAESAYARAPHGERGAEALWLGGHAAARIHDCNRAIPALEGAMSAGPQAPWRQDLLFELAQCEESNGGPTAVSLYATLIASSTDPVILRRARMRQGHALVLRGDATAALAALGTEDSLPARFDRAMAFAQLGRGNEALAELAAPLAAADTSVRWTTYIDTLAVRDTPATDLLVDRLLAFPAVTPERKSTWLLAAARDALLFDPAAADQRLQRLATRPPGAATSDGRLLEQQLRLTRPTTLPALRAAVDSMSGTQLSDDGFAGRHVLDLLSVARELLARNDVILPGAPSGDLSMFGLAALACDSLGSPRLGAWFLARVEKEWPRSPYVAKALMAREPLEPDSLDSLLVRLRRLGDNPYVAAANGDLVGRVRATQLEDSLGGFVARMWATRRARP